MPNRAIIRVWDDYSASMVLVDHPHTVARIRQLPTKKRKYMLSVAGKRRRAYETFDAAAESAGKALAELFRVTEPLSVYVVGEKPND